MSRTVRNLPEYVVRVQELRRSNAATVVPSARRRERGSRSTARRTAVIRDLRASASA